MVKRLSAGIKRRVFDILSLELMGKKYERLVVNYIFLIFYTTLEGVFVNTLLYKISDNGMASVMIYRAITYVAAALTMHLAALAVHKKSALAVLRMGAYFFLLMYAVLFFGIRYMDKLSWLVAFLSGTGGAFYWSAHNILVGSYTNRNNRDVGIASLGVVQGVITLACPVLSGFIISGMPGEFTGYRIMFGLGIAAVLAQLRVMTTMADAPQSARVSQLKLVFKLIWKKLTYKLLLAYEFIRGIREGTFAFILNMLLFEIITDEALVGINTLLTGIMAILGSWAFGRVVRAGNRARYMAIATTVLLAVCATLFFKLNAAMVMMFTVVNAFFQLFLINCCSNTSYDVLGQNECTRKCMGEMLAFREGALALGRILGIMLLNVFPATATGYVTAMCLLTVLQYASVFVVSKTQVTLNRRQNYPVRQEP